MTLLLVLYNAYYHIFHYKLFMQSPQEKAPFPLPENEAQRLQALYRYEILDSGAEDSFNRLVEIVAKLFRVPIAIISLVDAERAWFKASNGIVFQEVERQQTLCSWAIMSDEVYYIANTKLDERTADNTFVNDECGFRFYAGSPLITPDGFPLGTLCILDTSPREMSLDEKELLKDLSKVVMSELEIRLSAMRTVKLQKDLLGIVIHDLRNPLASITMTATMVRTYFEKMSHEALLQHMDNIMTSSKRMTSIISSLLDTSTLENGIVPSTIETFDVIEFIRQTTRSYASQAFAKNISIHLDLPMEALSWSADQHILGRIIDNLLSNAVKYSPRNRNIWVTVSLLDAHTVKSLVPPTDDVLSAHISATYLPSALRLDVRDEGPGISTEEQQKLFGRFTRLTPRPTNGEPSLGLGLWITKMLVEALHGTIRCESVLGVGSTFIVEFPIQHQAQDASV
ncbi:MAG: GAF domain-containing sensor histidine kinase [Candidatus Kapabacteria bacterium]|jgi:signal transduction histidine kinase|nr:GAF domain-containing sensor histidine kinase [Candidatus Kapabacteria bacterium]